MASSEERSRPKLSADQAFAVCREFIPVGDMIYRYAGELRASGFSAFEPYEEHFRSFARDSGEYELHRRIESEMVKTLLGNPWPPLYVRPEYRRPLFKSPLLEELKARRDAENEVPESELESRYSRAEALWRSEIDPCRRHAAYLRVTDRELYEARWDAARDAMKLLLEEEAKRFATDLARAHTFDRDGRYALFAEVMERDGAPLGFSYDKRKSRPNYPVFSKPVTREWHLCWALEEPRTFLWNPFEGRFDLYWEIRHRDLRGSVSKAKPGEFLHIRHMTVVPGFFHGYRIFHGSDELETVIKAHLCLYGLMAPIIESGIQKILGKSAEQ